MVSKRAKTYGRDSLGEDFCKWSKDQDGRIVWYGGWRGNPLKLFFDCFLALM